MGQTDWIIPYRDHFPKVYLLPVIYSSNDARLFIGFGFC